MTYSERQPEALINSTLGGASLAKDRLLADFINTEPVARVRTSSTDSGPSIPPEAQAQNTTLDKGTWTTDSAGNAVFTYASGEFAGRQVVRRADGTGEVRYPRDASGEQRVDYFGPNAQENRTAYNRRAADGGWAYRYENGAQAYRSQDGRYGYEQVPGPNGTWTRTVHGPNPEDNYTIHGNDKGMYAWKIEVKYPDQVKAWAGEEGGWFITRHDGRGGTYITHPFGKNDLYEDHWDYSKSHYHNVVRHYRPDGTIV
jgi:hypothetical protein